MRAVVQRVTKATVSVDGALVGAIGPGLCALVGVARQDDETGAARLAERLWNLRIFADEQGKMNRSAADLGLELLVVSQFTLYADTRRGRRPSFVDAAPGDQAAPVVEAVVASLRSLGARVATGQFGSRMELAIVNDGPVTLILEA